MEFYLFILCPVVSLWLNSFFYYEADLDRLKMALLFASKLKQILLMNQLPKICWALQKWSKLTPKPSNFYQRWIFYWSSPIVYNSGSIASLERNIFFYKTTFFNSSEITFIISRTRGPSLFLIDPCTKKLVVGELLFAQWVTMQHSLNSVIKTRFIHLSFVQLWR